MASNTIKLVHPTEIDNKNFMKLVNSYGSGQTRDSIIESKIRKVKEENEEKNPEFYRTLKERLEQIIAKQPERKITDATEFIKLQTLFIRRIICLLLIYHVLQPHKVIDW